MKLRERIGLWLLGIRLEEPADKKEITPGIAFGIGDGNVYWNKWDPKAAIEDGYKASVWVYRCINRKSTQAASVPWVVQTKVKEKWEEAANHSLMDLIRRPNPFYSWSELIEGIATYLDLTGTAYIGVNRAGSSRELWLIPAHLIKPVPSKTDVIGYYEYTLDGRTVKLAPWDVIYFRYMDPSNPIGGISPLQAAAKTVDTDIEAVNWNKYAMQNRAVPDIAFTANAEMNKDQFLTFKDLLKEEYQRAKNARKPFLLGNFKAEKLGLSPVEMDFIESRKMTRIEICAAFDVPPMLVGIPDASTYANYETAQKAFWLDTIIPFIRKLREVFNTTLAAEFGDNVRLNYDLSDVPALNEDVNSLHERIRKDWESGLITRNEGRAELGYEAVPDGDFFLMPANKVRSDGASPVDVSQPKKMSRWQPEFKAFNLETDEQKTAYWKAFDERRERYYDSVAGRVKKRFQDELEVVIKALEKSEGNVEAVSSAVEGQKDEWEKLLKAVYVAVIEDFGSSTFDGFKASPIRYEVKAETFDVWADEVQRWIDTVAGLKITQITETTLEGTRKELAEGVANGEGIPELAKRLQQLYDGYSRDRSVTIARTEVIAASNAGSRFAAKQTELDLRKEWISTRDSRTRTSHRHLDGQVKDFDELYSNGLMFPGDPSGPAREVINCRCTEGYLAKR